MTSWQTTLAGAALILAACVAMALGKLDPIVGGGMVAGGLGLIRARDNNVPSTMVPAAAKAMATQAADAVTPTPRNDGYAVPVDPGVSGR